jgi:hypothetical protein
MININLILRFIKKQWFGFVVIAFWIFVTIIGEGELKPLIEKRKKLDVEIAKEQKKIDTIYIENIKIKKKIKYIKQKENDTIKIIDTMSISELQRYFSDRYNKKDSIN